MNPDPATVYELLEVVLAFACGWLTEWVRRRFKKK